MHGKTKIQMLFAKGKRFSCGRLTIVYRPSPEQTAGFIASKNIGGAAKRNKAKRLLREAYRMNKGNFKGLSMIFYAQGTLQSDEVLNAFERFARVR
jgi:ribonuclease P protein component